MGLSDRFGQVTKRAKDRAVDHKEQIDQALGKAAQTADQRTGGRYHDQIANAESKAGTYLDGLQPDTSEKPRRPHDEPTPDRPTLPDPAGSVHVERSA